MMTDDLQTLREFRAEVAPADEETRRKIYAHATSTSRTPGQLLHLLRMSPRHRRLAAPVVAGLSVAVGAAIYAGLLGSAGTHSKQPSKGSLNTVVTEPASPSASGCAALRDRLSAAAGLGQSVIKAVGLLDHHPRLIDGTPYWRMDLTDVSTLSGKSLAERFFGWIQATPNPAPDAADAPGLWARDGHLIAIVTPSRVARTQLGPLLSTAPLVGDKVILSTAACWVDDSLTTTDFNGPLNEVPGSNAYTLAEQSGGFGAISLTQILQLLHS